MEPLLHDDFYDEAGNAEQPRIPVVDSGDWPFPRLSDALGDVSRLFDLATVAWSLDDPIKTAILELDPDLVEHETQVRFEMNPNWHHRARMIEIAATSLGVRASSWFRGVMTRLSSQERVSALRVGHRCLLSSEAFDIAVDLNSAIPSRGLCLLLADIGDVRAITWLENCIESPVSQEWGQLALSIGIDWDRLRRWFARGRPLSLVALDVMHGIVVGQLKETRPSTACAALRGRVPPERDVRDVLARYAAIDDAPRVTQRVDFVLSHLHPLLRQHESTA